MEEDIEDMDAGIDKNILANKQQALATQYLTAQYRKAGKEFLKATADVLINGAIKSTKTLVSGLQNGASGVNIASDLMINALDSTQSEFSLASKAASGVGELAAVFSKSRKGRVIGAGISLLGDATGYLTEKSTELAKFGIEVLTKEVEKTVNAFNTATSAGALFGRGMDDLRFYSSRAGLTVDQFAEVLKNNSGDLAASGYTVTEATKIVGNVTSRFAVQTGKSGNTLQREMLNLGFGFQQQAEIAAQVTADLRKVGGKATNGQMADATADLAKNMRIIADITGEDAKAKLDQAKKQSEQYAFFAKVTEIARKTNDPKLPERIRTSLALMDATQQRSFIQATVLDGAVTDIAANIYNQADAGREAANTLLAGHAQVKDILGGFARAGDKLVAGTDETAEAISRAAIANGSNADLAMAGSDLAQHAYKVNSDTLDRAFKDAEQAAGAKGKLQDSVMNAEIAAQKMRLALQDTLTPAIQDFARVTKDIISGLEKQMAKLGFKSTGGQGTESTGATGHFMKEAFRTASGVIGAALAETAVGLAGLGTGGAALIAVPAAGVGGYEAGSWAFDKAFGNDEGYAHGGIASGPTSGYQTTLHGTEAVVPLPDGDNIPVKMMPSASSDSNMANAIKDGITVAMSTQTTMLTEILGVLRDSNSLASKIVQNTY